MKTSNPTDAPRALFSKDGTSWHDGSPMTFPATPDPGVTKLVIGTLEDDAEKQIPLDGPAIAALANLSHHFPALTHLHLWGLKNLETLGSLPQGLQELDVRKCGKLARLPALPESLELLDLGGCAKIAKLPAQPLASLKRLYFDGCSGLQAKRLAVFLEDLAAPALVEIDGSGCPAVESLDELPASLVKVVFRDCPKLRDAKRVADLVLLDHLNLGGCAGLEELPALPGKIRHVVLHGSEGLVRFNGQDIGPYDRGTKPGQNVAKTLLSRQKFGEELAVSAHAKLLMLGDGRVGKTTLAKRLQWETLDALQREARAKELQPTPLEDPTHKMHFWHWQAPLRLAEPAMEQLTERAAARGLALPVDAAGDLTGSVRIWDFGGQEIYHNTHRVFAGEGSVYLIVWREGEPDWPVIEARRPRGCEPEEWREWNRRRPLDYWLDYVFSIRPDARVALVCTCCGQGQPRPDWTKEAPRHANTELGRKLRCFYLDSLEDDCGSSHEYQLLTDWLKTECGREAERIGIVQPAFFGQTADQVDTFLRENDDARRAKKRGKNLLFRWTSWQERVMAKHRESGSKLPLETTDVEAISGYLHDAGQIFLIRHGAESAVLVDQSWATGMIYEMLRPGGPLHEVIQYNQGWFPIEHLDEVAEWKELDGELQREQLIQFMETSRLLVRVIDEKTAGSHRVVFVANEKWLLPEEKSVAVDLQRRLDLVTEQPGMTRCEKFSFENRDISEFDFRILMAHLG